ncbi:MAG: DUF3305 domain-containing protein [Thiogranum sp.]
MEKAFPVSIIVGFQSTCDNRWESGYWKVTGLVAGGSAGGDGIHRQPLHAATEGTQYLWTGLSVELHRDDAESYYFNIVSDTPRVFVVCNQQEAEPLKPFIATLSYDEAASYMEADEVVESVAMPAELYRWVEQYVLENYLPEKRKKRKRNNWKEADSDRSGRR